jgi:hypothetical protein
MKLEIGLSDEGPVNTSYAPLAVLGARYQATGQLAFFSEGEFGPRRRVFSAGELLRQVLWSMLAGCETLGEVKGRLSGERALASAEGWARFADQSTLSRLLDGLSLKQIEALRAGMLTQMQMHSQVRHHDWRGYLWLDFDLSGLPCSGRAEESQKGYFSDKKTRPDGNWRGSVPGLTARRSTQKCIPVASTRAIACARRSKAPKLL